MRYGLSPLHVKLLRLLLAEKILREANETFWKNQRAWRS